MTRRRQPPGYSKAEVIAAGGALPGAGPVCHRCGVHIPQFADLTLLHRRRIGQLVREGRSIMAAAELRLRTECSPLWAAIWVRHAGRPTLLYGKKLCPFCGKPLIRLKPSRARLCQQCGRGWYDDPRLHPLPPTLVIPVDPGAPCYPAGLPVAASTPGKP